MNEAGLRLRIFSLASVVALVAISTPTVSARDDSIPAEVSTALAAIDALHINIQRTSYSGTYENRILREYKSQKGSQNADLGPANGNFVSVPLDSERVCVGRFSVQRDTDRQLIIVDPTEASQQDIDLGSSYAIPALYARLGDEARFYRHREHRVLIGPFAGLNAVWSSPRDLFLLDNLFDWQLTPDWVRIYGSLSKEDADVAVAKYGVRREIEQHGDDESTDAISIREAITIDHLLVRGKPKNVGRILTFSRNAGWMPTAVTSTAEGRTVLFERIRWESISGAPFTRFPAEVVLERYLPDENGKDVLQDVQTIRIALDSVKYAQPLTDVEILAHIPQGAEEIRRTNPPDSARSLPGGSAAAAPDKIVGSQFGLILAAVLVVTMIWLAAFYHRRRST